jgi:hypothetical protein
MTYKNPLDISPTNKVLLILNKKLSLNHLSSMDEEDKKKPRLKEYAAAVRKKRVFYLYL